METKFGDLLKEKFDYTCNTAQLYENYLDCLQQYGIKKFKQELHDNETLEDGKLSNKHNVFLKIIDGIVEYPNMLLDNGLEKYSQSYQLFGNLEFNDANYLSTKEEHLGKVSMSKFHKFISPKTTDFTYMNALTLCVDNNNNKVEQVLDKLVEMKSLAIEYANKNGITNIGLYVHVYPLNSIQLLHIHILDKDNLSPTYDYVNYKNLELDDVISVLTKKKN